MLISMIVTITMTAATLTVQFLLLLLLLLQPRFLRVPNTEPGRPYTLAF